MFYNGASDKGYLLFLGKLDPIKGIYHLLKASQCAQEVCLILAGRANDKNFRHVSAMMPPNVDYVGMKQGEELKQLIRGSRAVILPSIWYENQPLSILESFAMGKPVIASDLGGMTP